MDNESKFAVTGKRKYATEGEALATAAHQIASNGAPKQLRAYLIARPGTSRRTREENDNCVIRRLVSV